MTMYEKLLENSTDKNITSLIFKHMDLDYNFPAPDGSRRSGKTIYKNILMLTKFLSDASIRGLVFDTFKQESESFKHRPNHLIVYYHNREWAERNCKQISEVIKDMFDENYRYYFKFERDGIFKI